MNDLKIVTIEWALNLILHTNLTSEGIEAVITAVYFQGKVDGLLKRKES